MKTVISSGELEKKSLAELTAIYNQTAVKKIKKFKDKPTGVRRVLAELANSPKAQDKTASTKSTPRKTKSGEIKSPSFNLKARKDRSEIRKGSKRARVLQMLQRKNGATIQEVMSDIGWDRKTAFDGIRLIHTKVGYGLKTDDNGRIRATT